MNVVEVGNVVVDDSDVDGRIEECCRVIDVNLMLVVFKECVCELKERTG